MDDMLNPRKRPRDDNEISEEDVKQKQEKQTRDDDDDDNDVVVIIDDKREDASIKELQTSSHQYFELNIEDLVDVRNLLKANNFLDTNWLDLGLQLGLLMNTLKTIEAQCEKNVSRCLLECLTLWLQRVDKVDERGGPNWDTLANALSEIGERFSADNVRKKVKEAALQKYISSLSQSMINPVKVSQLLFSERCINEATLDEMEKPKVSLDEKMTTLLSAIHTAVSSDYKKLKVLAKILFKFEKTRILSKQISSEYIWKFPDDQMTVDNVSEVVNDQLSNEDRASDILCCHYGTLSRCFYYSADMGQLLHEENVISKAILSTAQSLSKDEASFHLLKAVRHAVHTNYHNLVVFASVLLKFTSCVPCANAILEDCEEIFPDLDMSLIQPNNSGTNEDTTLAVPVESSSSLIQDEAKPIPRSLSHVFGSSRKEFALTFSKIRKAINASPPPLEELKEFLEDGYSYLQPQLVHCNSISEMLRIVKDHCTLIDISCLEGIVERFDIKEAKTHIQVYKNFIQSLCEKTKAYLCLNENFKVTKMPSLLKCETIEFVLDWDPKSCTLEDIKDILSESLEMNVQIRYIREGNSIIVICFFPLSPAILIIIAKAQESLEVLKKKGLLKLTVGYCTIYDKCKRDEETMADREEIAKLRHQLETKQTIIKKQTMEIDIVTNRRATEKKLQSESVIWKKDTELKVEAQQNQKTMELESTEKNQATKKKLLSESANREEKLEAQQAIINKQTTMEIETIKDLLSESQQEIETQHEIITSLTLELRERDEENENLKQILNAYLPKVEELIFSDQELEETQTMSSPETSIPTISEDIDQLTDVEKANKGMVESGHNIGDTEAIYSTGREIVDTDKPEVLFRSYHVTHLPNKEYQEWDELPYLDEDRGIQLRDVPVEVKRLCHVTHNQPASKIDQGNHFIFKPKKKIGKAGYDNYDGSPIGETFVICEPTDQPPTNDTKYRYINPDDPDDRVFPGCYIWWSIDCDRYPPLLPGYSFSRFFTSSSRYGNVKFSGYIMQLLRCYQEAYNINPLPHIQFRCGGTLRYNNEICKVVIVCTEIHYPQPQDEFPLMWEDHDIMYNRDGRITFVKPLGVVIRNIVSKKNDEFYSWDTYAFAFYFPDDTYELLCPKSEKFERSEVRHYKCHVSQPDPKNGNKYTCPNLLHTRDDSESDEEEQSSLKKPKVEDYD